MKHEDTQSPLDEYFQALKESQPERDPRTAAQGSAAFLAQVEQKQSMKQPGWITRIRESFASLSFQGSRQLTAVAASLLLALILTFGAVGGTVYASQDSLPNQALYGVKIFAEDVRLSLANQPQDKIDLIEKFSQRRVEELMELSEQGEELPQSTLTRLEQHTETMLQLATEQEDDGVTQSLNRIRTALQMHEEVIAKLQEKESGKAVEALTLVQEKLQQKIQLAEQGLKNPGTFREKMKGTDPFDNDPGKSDSAGTPEDKGQPDDTAAPEDKGKPDDAGTPENKGKPEETGPPEDKGIPDDPGKPDNPGRPSDGKP